MNTHRRRASLASYQHVSEGCARYAVLAALLLSCGGGPAAPVRAEMAEMAERHPASAASSPSAPIDAEIGPEAAVAEVATARAPVEAPDAPPPRPRIGSTSHYTWIYKSPSRRGQPIGYVRPGTSVTLKDTESVAGSGCVSSKWLQIEPKGYVCVDSAATLDLESPIYKALSEVTKPRDHVLPYQYAYSTGAPMYGRVPEDSEIAREERAFRPIDKLPRDNKPRTTYEELATYAVMHGSEPIPSFVGAGAELPRMRGYAAGLVRKTIPAGSLLSFSRAFEVRGRTYLLSTDLTLVPADRIRPFRETQFRGVTIDGSIQLPIAWTKGSPKNQYRKLENGTIEATDNTWPPRTMLPLTGARQTHKGWVYLETREAGTFIRERDASVVEAKTSLPSTVKGDDKWIEFSAGKGTFTLYVGKMPVFSTLASPGRGGGAPRGGMSNDELVEGSYTPLGTYRVTYKTKVTTMTPEGSPNPKDHWIQDVPYAQYFRPPFAIHAAYWHEDFGMPKSGGCINLSPSDARFVFSWTDPPLPEDWSGVSSTNEIGLGTPLIIRR